MKIEYNERLLKNIPSEMENKLQLIVTYVDKRISILYHNDIAYFTHSSFWNGIQLMGEYRWGTSTFISTGNRIQDTLALIALIEAAFGQEVTLSFSPDQL